MSKRWSDADKKIVKTALDRARKRAEEETLLKFRNTSVDSIEDLWALELKIRAWRREVRNQFGFSYDGIEELLHEFLNKGWTKETDLQSLSEKRFERIMWDQCK